MTKYIRWLAGSVLFAVGFQFFLLPNNVLLGGVSGLSMIAHHLTGFPAGVLLFVFNVPLFLISARVLGKKAVLTALCGAALNSVLIDLAALSGIVATTDVLLAAVYGGAIIGTGLGLMFSVGASGGGSDLIARMFRTRRPDISLGRFIMLIDAAVITLGAFTLQRFDSAMYALLTILISNRIIDAILYGVNYAKVAYIITNQGDMLKDEIMQSLQRGVTILPAVGGYSGEDKTVLLCAIKQNQQITELKRLVEEIDPGAFIIIQNTREVQGNGFGVTHNR